MSEKIESTEEVRRGVTKELKKLAWKACLRLQDMISEEEWDRAVGAVGAIRYILEAAKEWKQT